MRARGGIVQESRQWLKPIFLGNPRDITIAKGPDNVLAPDGSVSLAIDQILSTPNDKPEFSIGRILNSIEAIGWHKDAVRHLRKIGQSGRNRLETVEAP